MTIEEVIRELKEIKCLCCDYSIKDSLNECACINREVLKIAIRSLEACRKIKEEMDHCTDYYELGSMVLKHLREVENE